MNFYMNKLNWEELLRNSRSVNHHIRAVKDHINQTRKFSNRPNQQDAISDSEQADAGAEHERILRILSLADQKLETLDMIKNIIYDRIKKLRMLKSKSRSKLSHSALHPPGPHMRYFSQGRKKKKSKGKKRSKGRKKSKGKKKAKTYKR